VADLIDSGWSAWLPRELTAALEALDGGPPARRAFRLLLERELDAERRERWERFRLVAPSRLDVPYDADGLTADGAYALLEGLGLVAGRPPHRVAAEAVELVLTLDHDDVRELEALRSARDPHAGPAGTPVSELPSTAATFGAEVGRNDPCPCGSGRKFKRCHGA
jgi:hypothetical protein